MAYSTAFADRIRKILSLQTTFAEKETIDGVAFLVNEKMCVAISRDKSSGVDRLMARIDPQFYYAALKRQGCHEMDFAGRPMVGFVFIHPEGYATEEDLVFWIGKSLEYNRVGPTSMVKKKRALLAPPEKKIHTIKPLPKYKPPKVKRAQPPTSSRTKKRRQARKQ
jgi:hypothetical protein